MNSFFVLPLQREKGQKLLSILDQPWLKSLPSLSHVQWKDHIYRIIFEFYLKGEKRAQKESPDQLYYNWCLHLSGLSWRRHHLELLFRHIPGHTQRKKIVQHWCGKSFCKYSPFSVILSLLGSYFIVDLKFAQGLLRRKGIKHAVKDAAYNPQWKLS